MPIALKRTLEVLHASDGATYLLRGAADAEFVVEDANAQERALIDLLLAGAGSLEELRRDLARCGFEVDAGTLEATVADLTSLGLLEEEDPVALIGPVAAERYDRQLAYFADVRPGEAAALQAALGDARVLLVGVGGLGTWTAAALACSGVGHLTLVDDDVVELSNLNRQFLYRHEDLGRLKAEAAAEALSAFDPALGLTVLAERVAGPADAERIVAGHDFVVELADWPPHELSRWLDAACWAEGIARISAAQFPPRLRIGPTYLRGRTPCLQCQEGLARRDFPLYDELVAMRKARPAAAPTLGPASAMVGAMIAGDVVHHLTGIAEPATLGTALIVDLRDLSIRREPLERDPACPRCGEGTEPSLAY